MFGSTRRRCSISAFTTFISLTSSSNPFGQELPLITRSQPSPSGTLLQGRPLAPGTRTSMNARLQFTGHQRQIVCSLVVLRNSSASIDSKPRKLLGHPGEYVSSAHSAAPMAPASPEYGWIWISAFGTLAGNEVDLSLDHGKVAVRPALEHETATGRLQV